MRLRSALIIAIVSLVFGTVALVAGNAYWSAQSSAHKLSQEVLEQATERIERVVEGNLDVATTESAFMKELFDRGELSADDPEKFARTALEVIASHPTLNYVSFSRESTGELAQASRDQDGATRVRFLTRHGDNLDLTDYAPEGNGLKFLRGETNRNANDPRPRPFYVTARDQQKSVWTETYAFFGEDARLGAPGVTLATPVRAKDGSLIGVLTADFDLHGISRSLTDLGLFEHGSAFIVEYRKDGTRAVIAHPTLPLLAQSKGSYEAVSIDAIQDPRVAAFAHALPTTFPPENTKMFPVGLDVDGVKYLGGFDALDGNEVHWVVCTIIPEDDVLGDVHKNERWTLIITLGGTLFAVLLALYIGASISHPLRVVADETEGIGQFRLEVRPLANTRIVEVARLSKAVEEMKRNLRSFRKYVPADVVRELVSSGEEANLSGKRARLTIHFSDIADFTSIAETTPPEEMVAMLSEYLDEMTKPILASGGTVDKFIGDAIMAFWGAPRPDAEHALHACEAALVNRARLEALNVQWQAAGRPRMHARAGLHTGDVIVGNIGTHERFDYTVIGDSVNLASRLEGLNKKYGTSLMISEATYALVKDKVIVRPLDRVSVKGKRTAVTVYELVGMKGSVSEALLAKAAAHTTGFEHYIARRFDEAATLLGPLAAAGDMAAKVLLDRCEGFVAAPPSQDWDSTEHITTK